jgi:hypothetical protein
MSGWDDFFSGLAELAVDAAIVGGAAYLVSKSMNQRIDELVNISEEKAIPALADAVPRMDNEHWEFFYNRLYAKAQYNEYAGGLLVFSACVRKAMGEIEQLLRYSVQEAVSLIADVFPQKDDIEKLAFFGTLNTYAGENIKAKAIFGKLQAALES